MPWVRLDDRFFLNPKVMQAGLEPRALYISGLCFCAGELTDGFIPTAVIPKLAALADVPDGQAATAQLVALNLWLPIEGGYRIHDYLQYNPSREKALSVREARAEAGSRGGKQRASKLLDGCQDGASDGAKQNPTPYPDPYPSPYPNHNPDQEQACAAPTDDGASPPAAAKRTPTRVVNLKTGYSPEFEHFWSLYPRRTDKWAAYGEWQKKLKVGVRAEDLIAAAGHFATYCEQQGTEEQYVPYGRKFLYQRLFESYVAGVPGQKPPKGQAPKAWSAIAAIRADRQEMSRDTEAS